MPFTMPDTYSTTTKKGAPKSKATIATYRTHLNRIADASGLTTVEEFVGASRKVISSINKLCVKRSGESAINFQGRKRVYYSAIFMVLPPAVLAKPNAFYKANKKLQDSNPADFKASSESE
jgi:hypothetical protein